MEIEYTLVRNVALTREEGTEWRAAVATYQRDGVPIVSHVDEDLIALCGEGIIEDEMQALLDSADVTLTRRD